MSDSQNLNLDTGMSVLMLSSHADWAVVKVLSQTLFSPFFCAFLPLSLYGHVKDFWHPAVVSTAIWTILICLFGASLYDQSRYRRWPDLLQASLSISIVSTPMGHHGCSRRQSSTGRSRLSSSPEVSLSRRCVWSTLEADWRAGGTGIGALLAQTLTMRNVTVVVLSKDPVKVDSDNGEHQAPSPD